MRETAFATTLFTGESSVADAVLRHADGVIDAILSGQVAPAGGRRLIIPALVNAHDHARPSMTSFGAANLPLESWILRATNKAMIEIARDQAIGMKGVMNFDNLVDEKVEKRRLQYSFSELIVSPEMKEIGIGDTKDDRMARAIGIIVEGYQLARAPAASEIFSREFLPPRAERELKYTAN